ncbi:RNA polymerase sporulation sigma factor SigF [Qiania dongpingensis]|uniref:RNA polymerase sigma factor n=1 Tax=Qiania dongpingensis TaxID=2763669 RepID=A0A7G9G7K7_9FIRM|nr:RNA polymerase sporulation sigma factor SigF [Qiania dongpingensis]QNM06789.1 RNA polymerase sporulation sigma factor SigF [Qiania dongpingensis]
MDETMELIQSAHAGDKEARDRLVSENMGLIWSVVRRFLGRGHEPEDLFQIGSIGLIKAIDKFDMSFDVRFSTYAIPMITGEIKRFLRDDGMIKISRSLKEMATKARAEKEKLGVSLGREPTLDELAGALQVEPTELAAAMESGAEVESLYKTIYHGDGNAIYLIDKLEDGREEDEGVLNKIVITRLLKELAPQEQRLIVMRYYMDKTQTQVAEELGISQVQVSRLEKKILQSMRRRL